MLFWCGLHTYTRMRHLAKQHEKKTNFPGLYSYSRTCEGTLKRIAYEYEHSKIPLIFIIVRPFLFVIELSIERPDIF